MKTYDAPWSFSLKIVTIVATLLLLGLTFNMLFIIRQSVPWWVALLPLIILIGCALFSIRGYTVTNSVIRIHRLFWDTRLSIADLKSAQFDPKAMQTSIRTFGNSGLYSISGYFWSRSLGAYRAFVTDPKLTVVLRFAKRTVVISPSDPQEFVATLQYS